jgi:putative oxidoreductase
MNFLNRYANTIYCIARIIIGLMYACHGGQKILGFPPGGHGSPGNAMQWTGAVIELGGGFLIAFGLFTRLAAFFAAGEMAVAYYFHASGMIAQMSGKSLTTPAQHFFPLLNGGEAAVFYCWFFLVILFYGAGWLSIDAFIGRGRTAAAITP